MMALLLRVRRRRYFIGVDYIRLNLRQALTSNLHFRQCKRNLDNRGASYVRKSSVSPTGGKVTPPGDIFGNCDELVRIKKAWDPDGHFNFQQAIGSPFEPTPGDFATLFRTSID